MAPLSQAEKADPTGDYIRFFVPELKNLKGKGGSPLFRPPRPASHRTLMLILGRCCQPDIHDPHARLSPAAFKALNYPAPIVDHKKARERALERYKNPGEKPDEEDNGA